MTRMKEKKDPTTLKAFFSLSFFSFSSSVTHTFPSPIKGEAGRHMKWGSGQGGWGILTQEHDTSTRLSGKRALSTRSLLPPETWDPLPLSPVCNPYCKPSIGNTSSSELDVGTFRPNQYKLLCPPSTPFGPDAQIQIYSSVVRKHRHSVIKIELPATFPFYQGLPAQHIKL